MTNQDRIKRLLTIQKSDGTDLNITATPLRVELRRGIEVVKFFTNEAWNTLQGIEVGASALRVLPDNIQFLVIVDGDELDTYIAGTYTIHAYYFEDDADFSDGSCRRYAKLDIEIEIL